MTSIIYYPGYSQVVITPNLITRTIATISNDYPMVITTTEDHGYVSGMMVRFLIPNNFEMVELNNKEAQVLDATDDTLIIDLDSTSFTPFAYPMPLPQAFTPPSVIPNSSGPYLPPKPLPYGNQNSFEGSIYNAGVP